MPCRRLSSEDALEPRAECQNSKNDPFCPPFSITYRLDISFPCPLCPQQKSRRFKRELCSFTRQNSFFLMNTRVRYEDGRFSSSHALSTSYNTPPLFILLYLQYRKMTATLLFQLLGTSSGTDAAQDRIFSCGAAHTGNNLDFFEISG